MTSQEFSHYLDQPELLYKLPLSDLQQLAVRFPYSPNVRLLLLLKTHLEGHEQEALYLSRCAAASFDRSHIYDLLRELDATVKESAVREEEVLELRELDALELEPLLAGDPQNSTPEENLLSESSPSPETDDSYLLPSSIGDEELADELLDELEFSLPPSSSVEEEVGPEDVTLWEEETPKAETAPEEGRSELEEPLGLLPESTPADPPQPAEEKVIALPDGLRGRLARIRRMQQARGKDNKEEVNRIARRSLVAHEEVASETLAGLLVRQGQYQNAIRMYQRLILLYPEKKTIFAGLIKDLQEKL